MLSLDHHVCFAVYSTAHMFNRLYRPMLDEIGLTYPQYLTLVVLAHEGPQAVGDIGERLKLESSTLTPLLKRMERAGLVSRNRSASDERIVNIALTEAGSQLIERIPPINTAIAEAIGETEAQREVMLASLVRMRDRLEAALP